MKVGVPSSLCAHRRSSPDQQAATDRDQNTGGHIEGQEAREQLLHANVADADALVVTEFSRLNLASRRIQKVFSGDSPRFI